MEMELTGSYPIIIDGSQSGKVEITRDGLFWCFCAESERLGDEILRLSVYGDGGEGYLGVMEPEGQKLRLTRKLSRSVLSAFPKSITHGGRQGELPRQTEDSPPPALSPAATEESHSEALSTEAAIPAEESIPPPAPPPTAVIRQGCDDWLPCPCPCWLFSGLREKSSFGGISGALSLRRQ